MDQERTEGRDASVGARRERERSTWGLAFLASVLVHLLILLLGPRGAIPLPGWATIGDERAREAEQGLIEVVQTRSPPPAPVLPPPVPTPEVVLPEPETFTPEAVTEVVIDAPEVPDPGVGTTDGTDLEEEQAAGVPDAAGTGAGGEVAVGTPRVVPPSPRGMILPPTNRELRGSQVEVWVFVNEQGRVVSDSTQLRPPTSDRRFNEQLVREAAQWVFEPAREDGTPIAAWFPYLISME